MKRNGTSISGLLLGLILLLTLLVSCGRQDEPVAAPGAAQPSQDEAQPTLPKAPAEKEPEAAAPEATQPEDGASGEAQPDGAFTNPAGADPEPAPAEPEPDPVTEPDSDPEPEPESEPAEPAPAPEPEPDVWENGAYTANVTLEGGTGRASVASPAQLRCEDGQFWAIIEWSSPNFDYMKVNGEKYELISEPGGNSVFEIPVAAFDQALDVVADTIAMSEPHEVEYTLTFDSSSLSKQ